ncbi:right-handed parallel beta-helix repeat-containing protein [Neobacillus sp. NPDC097160]|uniref:right-handed parallel beta-helix repeat-containing protein n=1 Tax=Neobacillus sp. NPDC097160 TaxID=3364298 RepID=UPI0037FEA20E
MKKQRDTLLFAILFLGAILLLSKIALDFQKFIIVEASSEIVQMTSRKSTGKPDSIKSNKNTYILELTKWGIFNDGTHPKETTKGINNALKWAQDKGYTTFYIPAGTYLVSKGKSDDDPNARINMVSNMTFLLDEKTVIQKETNGFEIYSTLILDSEAENVTIKGGTLRGDRETHDFSQKGEYTGGTHEWGNGINTAGARNIVIDGVKIEKFTGDGIEIGGSTIYGDYITEKDLELGGINDKGEPILQKGKIRSNNHKVENFSNPVYKNPHYRNVMMWLPKQVEGNYDLYFYRKDGSFIKADKNQHFNSTWGYSEIPDDADYFRVVFNSNSTKDVEVNRMTVAVTKNMTIKNCDIGYNRRQGITVGASDDIKIINNKIHHTKGTAPESGIDIEPGFYPAINTLIKGNQFLNNKIHMVFSYGGKATVEGNYFGPNVVNGVGFSINPSYSGAIVDNNKFDHTGFVTWGNTKFLNNKLISSSASFEGGSKVTVDEVDGIDSNLSFSQTHNNGVKVSNVNLKSSGKQKEKGGIAVYGKSIYMTNIVLQGNNEMGGDGNSKSVYEHVTFINSPEMILPRGTYNECSTNGGEFSLNIPGKIELNKCKFKNTTFYTYNPKTEATIQHSTFDNVKNATGPIILAMEAKNLTVLNNRFNVLTTKNEDHAIIQIGRDASVHNPTKVLGATVKDNELSTNIKRVGIDTTNGGVGAPPYLIENNTLYNANLDLKENDINLKNQLLNKK